MFAKLFHHSFTFFVFVVGRAMSMTVCLGPLRVVCVCVFYTTPITNGPGLLETALYILCGTHYCIRRRSQDNVTYGCGRAVVMAVAGVIHIFTVHRCYNFVRR